MGEVIRKFIKDSSPSKDEVGAIKLITMKKQLARAAIDNREFPDGVDQAIMTAYYKAAMDNFAEAQHMENEWWASMIKKFSLPIAAHFDFESETFYILEEEPSK